MPLTDNLNIAQFRALASPEQFREKMPLTESAAQTVFNCRSNVQDILAGKDKRLIVITGPCSIHDSKATLEYVERLGELNEKVKDKILIVMRAYFEKPRTIIGWKGMLYDPYLDNSYDIEEGLERARKLLLAISEKNLPAATEFLDPIVPQYFADLISWAAIGARTTESQIHRQMASGLSMPIGFKNATDGNLSVAIDAIKAARSAHSFLGIDQKGSVIIAETLGNQYGHLVMRGGLDGPNYTSEYVAFADVLLRKADISTGLIIDCSHANSHKDHKGQRNALNDIAGQIRDGNDRIVGVMLESFLEEGKQAIGKVKDLKYGVSITDSCIGWNETEELICRLAE